MAIYCYKYSWKNDAKKKYIYTQTAVNADLKRQFYQINSNVQNVVLVLRNLCVIFILQFWKKIYTVEKILYLNFTPTKKKKPVFILNSWIEQQDWYGLYYIPCGTPMLFSLS